MDPSVYFAAVYRWLTRALFLAGAMVWLVARTWVADPLFAHWQAIACVTMAVGLLMLLQGAARPFGPTFQAIALLASALAVGLAVGLCFVAAAHLNIAHSFFVLACVYALLVVARSNKLWRHRPSVDAAVACGLGVLCACGIHFGAEPSQEIFWAALAATAVNAGAMVGWSSQLARLHDRGVSAARASLLPWGILAVSFGLSSLGAALWHHSQVTASTELPATHLTPELLRAKLTPEQYRCTQEGGTERPFANAYWDSKAAGIYVDLISGEPLFSSMDKYDSGSGWPSFTKPIADTVQRRRDKSLNAERTEVRSRAGQAHLGHVFDDGPGPTGERFCINSAALRFVPLGEMKAQGYGRYLFAFTAAAGLELATLAGGCFWGMEQVFEHLPGVVETQVGYAGGPSGQASYEQVATGQSGHAEALQVLFDPAKLSYQNLLFFFFKVHDPTTVDRQGNDVGSQYRSAIFYNNADQEKVAKSVMAQVTASKQWPKPLTTQLQPLQNFWRAEEEHQGYIDHHPNAYTCHTERNLNFSPP